MHLAYMGKKVQPRFRRQYRRTFLREWRDFKGLTLEEAADRVGTLTGEGFTHSSLSRIERGLQPYSQAVLEALADAYGTDPASLLMRNPSDQEAIWSLWDEASAGERQTISEVIRAVRRTGTK